MFSWMTGKCVFFHNKHIQQFWVFRLKHSALVYEAGSFEPPFDSLLITGCMGWSMSLLNFVVCVNTLAFLLFLIVCDPVSFQFHNRDGSYGSCYNSHGLGSGF